jgi:hypothetical protein
MERANGWTPVDRVAYRGHLPMVRAILSWGADPNGEDDIRETARALAKQDRQGVVKFLDACGSILVVRSAAEVRRLAKYSALKHLPKDLIHMVGSMLV